MRALARLGVVCALGLAVAGCITTPTGDRKVDVVKACNVATIATLTVRDVADVLVARGIAPEQALRIATAARSTEAVAAFVCPLLVMAAPLKR